MSYLPIYKTLKQSPAVVAILGAEPRVYEDIAPVGATVPMSYGKTLVVNP